MGFKFRIFILYDEKITIYYDICIAIDWLNQYVY